MADRRRRRSTECDTESDDSGEYVTEEEETADEEEGEAVEQSTEGERQSGDGEEQPKLDDDEDRQNPAYIPRRGAFYEHDMRLDPNDVEAVEPEKEEKRGKGRLWKDDSKWGHDRFDMFEQAPKSRQELIAMYGYDITQYDEPPKNPPKMSGRRRGGNRNRKPQFQDFLPDDAKRGGGDVDRYQDNRYHDDEQHDPPPRQPRGGRGRRGSGRGRGSNRGRSYSDMKDDNQQRNRSYSADDNYDNHNDNYDNNNYSKRQSYEGDDNNYGRRENYRKRDNYRSENSNYGNRDDFGGKNYDSGRRGSNRGYRGERRGDRGGHRDREHEGGREGVRGRGRGGGRGGYRENQSERREERESPVRQSGRGKGGHEYERQYSGGSKDNRERPNFDRQQSGNRDYERQDRQPVELKSDPSLQEGKKFKTEAYDRIPARSYEKPTPKSYYTLSVTDDEKLLDDDYVQGSSSGIQDMNVTVTGDKRSFKDRERARGQGTPRGQGSSQQVFEERREAPIPVTKHQPSLPPRLQQQQQQQERNKQRKQQQPQQNSIEKQDAGQGRSNKRYSSQRQRPVTEGPGFNEQPVAHSPPTHQVVSSIQQYQQTYSPPVVAGPQPALVRPTIAQPRNASPQMSVPAPAMVLPRGPPPQAIIPIPGPAPPPGTAPAPPAMRPPPPPGAAAVFATVPGSLPTTAVIGGPAQLMAPTGMLYAGPPPPTFPVPVPGFSGQTPPIQATQTPGETVRGGTTYYSQASGGSATSGTTYYSPEMQIAKQSRVQVRRPKVPLPIVNPEDVKKGDAAGKDGGDSEGLGTSNEDLKADDAETELLDDVQDGGNDDGKPLDVDDAGPGESNSVPEQAIDNLNTDTLNTDNSSPPENVDSRLAANEESVTDTEKDNADVEDKSEVVTELDGSERQEKQLVISDKAIEDNDNRVSESVKVEGEIKDGSESGKSENVKVEDAQSTENVSKDTSENLEPVATHVIVKTEPLTPTLTISTKVTPLDNEYATTSETSDKSGSEKQTAESEQSENVKTEINETGNPETVAESGDPVKEVKEEVKSEVKEEKAKEVTQDDDDEFVDSNEQIE